MGADLEVSECLGLVDIGSPPRRAVMEAVEKAHYSMDVCSK